MTFAEKNEFLAEISEAEEHPIVLFDGYEDALIGYCDTGDGTRAVYDYDQAIDILVNRDGMTYDDAIEFFEYNTVRSIPYAGKYAPIFIHQFKEEQ